MKLTQVLLLSGLTTLSFATFADTSVAAEDATPVVTIDAQHSDANHPVNAPQAPVSGTLPVTADEDGTAPSTEAATPEVEQSAE